jgi:hypothetical protein
MATLKRRKDGDHDVINDAGEKVAVISHRHLMDYAGRCMDETLRDPMIISSKPTVWPSYLDDQPKVDKEVLDKTRQEMEKSGLNYYRAMKKVLASDKDLERRYHAAHSKEIL